jgi:hypothetical protein
MGSEHHQGDRPGEHDQAGGQREGDHRRVAQRGHESAGEILAAQRREGGVEHLPGRRGEADDEQIGQAIGHRVEAQLRGAEHAADHAVVELGQQRAHDRDAGERAPEAEQAADVRAAQ